MGLINEQRETLRINTVYEFWEFLDVSVWLVSVASPPRREALRRQSSPSSAGCSPAGRLLELHLESWMSGIYAEFCGG